jgi:gliding motility-associated-like protein
VPTEGGVLANDYDIDGDALSVSVTPLTDVAHGKISLATNGRFKYTSDKTFRGLDVVIYEVCDNGAPIKCSRAALVIRVDDVALKIYQAVTPNGDGLNDFLRIDGIDYYQQCKVQIFDRYNNLVSEIEGYDNETKVWRGQATKGIGNETLPEGTYFYIVNLGDGSSPIDGFVVLKRN